MNLLKLIGAIALGIVAAGSVWSQQPAAVEAETTPEIRSVLDQVEQNADRPVPATGTPSPAIAALPAEANATVNPEAVFPCQPVIYQEYVPATWSGNSFARPAGLYPNMAGPRMMPAGPLMFQSPGGLVAPVNYGFRRMIFPNRLRFR